MQSYIVDDLYNFPPVNVLTTYSILEYDRISKYTTHATTKSYSKAPQVKFNA